MLNLIFLLIGIGTILIESIMIFLWIGARWQYQRVEPQPYTPKTCVIIPCKGVHERFQENIKAFCHQNYKDYTIVFIVDSPKDPAYTVLKDVADNDPKVKLEVSEFIDGCSGKISALIKGTQVAGDVEVYVFADSDIKPHQEWLHYLVAYLNEKGVGAATGYRWYFPHDLKSLLMSAWNLAAILPFFYHKFNYTWGGSTAIKRKVFHEIEVEGKWRTGFADDLLLTEAVKHKDYKIKFVPKCVVESCSDEDLHDFIRWGSRQFVWVRWYYPSMWIISFLRMAGVKFLMLFGVFLIIVGFTLPGLLMVSTILIPIIYGWLGFTTMKKMMWYPHKQMGSPIGYTLMMPIVALVNTYNYLSSLFMKEVVWGGRTYQKSDVCFQKPGPRN